MPHIQPANLITAAEDMAQINPDVLVAERQMAVIEAAYGEDRDLLNQIVGRVQTAQAMAEFSLTVGVSQLAKVRENKLYKAMRGMKTADGGRFSGTWDEFCEFIGSSRQKVDEDIQNLHAFGEQALESMRSVGIGYREMRDFRRLPDDERAALVQIAETGDKDGLLEMLEDLIARQAKQKEAARAREQHLIETLDARDKVLTDKSKKVDDLATELAMVHAKARQNIEVPVADEEQHAMQLRYELHRRVSAAELAILGQLPLAIDALREHARTSDEPVHDLISGHLHQLAGDIESLMLRYNTDIPRGRATPDADIWDAVSADIEAKASRALDDDDDQTAPLN